MPRLEARMIAIAQNRLLYRSGVVIIYSKCEEGTWASTDQDIEFRYGNTETLDSETLDSAGGMPCCQQDLSRQEKRLTASQEKSWNLCNLAWQGSVESSSVAVNEGCSLSDRRLRLRTAVPGFLIALPIVINQLQANILGIRSAV